MAELDGGGPADGPDQAEDGLGPRHDRERDDDAGRREVGELSVEVEVGLVRVDPARFELRERIPPPRR